jgi:alpha-1,6-mannosyltransferase
MLPLLIGLGLGLELLWIVVGALGIPLCGVPVFATAHAQALPGVAAVSDHVLAQLERAAPGVTTACVAHPVAVKPLGLTLAAAGVLYVAALWLVDADQLPVPRALTVVIAYAVVFGLTLFALPSLLSSDVYSYAANGRITAAEHASPYVQPPSAFPDVVLAVGDWRDAVSVYGPFWERIDAGLAARMPGAGVLGIVLAYRLLALVTLAASAVLVWWLVGCWFDEPDRRRAQVSALLLWTWNPLILLELEANAHNEGVMLALVLLAFVPLTVLAARGSRLDAPSTLLWLAALTCLTLATLVKFVPGVVLALTGLVWLRQLPDWRSRLGLGLLAAILMLMLAVVVAWPWLGSPAILRPLLGAAAGGDRFENAWLDVPSGWLASHVLPRFGVGAAPAEGVARTLVWGVARLVFLVYLVLELTFVWRHSARWDRPALRALAEASTRLLLAMLLLLVTQVLAWYFTWPLALAALLGWRHPLGMATVLFAVGFLPLFYLREFQVAPSALLLVYVALAPCVLIVRWLLHARPVDPRAVRSRLVPR